MARVILGTRRSTLALRQAELVRECLRTADASLVVEIKGITTSGDRRREALTEIGGRGVFVKELETALLARKIDLAVHSLKDLPSEIPPGLALVAIPTREDPRDALVTRDGASLEDLRAGAVVATGSPRRQAFLAAVRPDLRFVSIRGNIDTRLRRLREGHCDALVLAAAGLRRLGVEAQYHVLPMSVILPAPGQGALALEARAEGLEDPVGRVVRKAHASELAAGVAAERAVLRALGGGCHLPLGAYGRVEDGRLRLEAAVAGSGGKVLRTDLEGSLAEAEGLGAEVAERLKAQGAGEILEAEGWGAAVER